MNIYLVKMTEWGIGYGTEHLVGLWLNKKQACAEFESLIKGAHLHITDTEATFYSERSGEIDKDHGCTWELLTYKANEYASEFADWFWEEGEEE
jgi:uncharacterized glyoxalase superfamily protein PhnB